MRLQLMEPSVHLGIDALLISAFLAGVKRTTGLTYVSLVIASSSYVTPISRPALSQVPNKDVRGMVFPSMPFVLNPLYSSTV